MGILAMAMRIETAYVVSQLTPILSSLKQVHAEVCDLVERCEILDERVERTQNRVLELISDIQPVWTDAYNLCGDPGCDGTCMVCSDGEYLADDDPYEKYCRRGRR